MKAARTITIVCIDDNNYTVQEGEAFRDRLRWDEMLGTIAELTHPRIGQARYRMQTPEQREDYERVRAVRLAHIRVTEDALDQSMLDALGQWAAAERDGDASELANARGERDRILSERQR